LELSGEARIKYYTQAFSFKSFENDPLILTPGARINFPNGLYTTLAGDFGLSSKDALYRSTWDRNGYRYSTSPVPTYGVQLSFGWSGIVKQPDTDKDGIIDIKDRCPELAEDKDGFEDEDGCPDYDNDGDGIADAKDKCPNEAASSDGCPIRIVDSDRDGLFDDKDKCPQQPEDMDGFQDDDGCPDPDNDNDGIADKKDLCPNQAEDIDGFEDADGCPDIDNDGDGVLDEKDKCPNKKGIAEEEGCPKAKEIKRGKLILSGVNFQPSRAILEPNSYRILDQVYESLIEWPEVKLEIQGYTDSQGNYTKNKKLSQNRADAVRIYLLQKGISSDRLRAIGFGPDSPIADNKTAEGRARNRRVELNRID
jgi:outer membrane protein OmpA-like peptidoglycan-associated protein